MYILYGIELSGYQEKIGESFKTQEDKEPIALFTTREKAKEYIEKRKLKRIQKGRFENGDRPYKKELSRYSFCEIEEYYPLNLEINPE